MKTRIVGNRSGVYVDPVTNLSYVNPKDCVNVNDVDLSNVDYLVVYRNEKGDMFIAQTSGHSWMTGRFVHLYKVN